MKLIIIIPAYNEASTIVDVINRIPKSFDKIGAIKIMVVDDGSTDNTAEEVKSKTAAIVISHDINKGVGAAFYTGINFALENEADIVVNIDADGQFNPLDITKLIKPILNGEADFVSASRFMDSNYFPQMPWIKFWGNKQISKMISWATKRKFHDVSCGFRAYNREALLNINLFSSFTYTQETFLDLCFKNLRIKEVPIVVKYFDDRQSRVCGNIFRYARKVISIILRSMRDYNPLKFFGGIGAVIFSLGVAVDLFMFYFYIRTGGFSPYKALGLLGLFLNVIGLGILFLSLLADMLYRIRMNQEKLIYYEKKRKYFQNKERE